jgi:FeS assembly protein IscX
MSLTWTDTRAVAELLFEKYDTLDPRTIRLADVRKWCPDLEDFTGRPEDATDALLQAIQTDWYRQWQDEYGAG